MNKETLLSEILKHKGIGPAGSKSLSEEQAKEAKILLEDASLNLTTQLTLITALLTLESNAFELDLIKALRKSESLNPLLKRFLDNKPNGRFEKIILSVINRKDLEEKEAKEAMVFFFDPNEPDCLKASFLEAQRLKRETTTENITFLNSFWDKAKRETFEGEVLLDFCNNYDGWARTANYSTFTALFLAYCSIPTLLHGLDVVAPKNGYTSQQILSKLDSRRFDENFNFYDQKDFFPALFAMKQMRSDMVKRPFLATIERLLQPLQAKNGNQMVIGYTHTAYKTEFARIIQLQNKTKTAIIIKGEEGSTQLPLGRSSNYTLYKHHKFIEGEISPEFFGISNTKNDKPKEISVDSIIESLKKGNELSQYALSVIEYNAKALVHLFDLEPTHTPNKEKLESFLHTLLS